MTIHQQVIIVRGNAPPGSEFLEGEAAARACKLSHAHAPDAPHTTHETTRLGGLSVHP